MTQEEFEREEDEIINNKEISETMRAQLMETLIFYVEGLTSIEDDTDYSYLESLQITIKE